MSNHLKTIIDLQNKIVKQNEHFKNFTTVMMKTIVDKDKEIHLQHNKYITFEKQVMKKIANQQIMIDCIKHGLEENSKLYVKPSSSVRSVEKSVLNSQPSTETLSTITASETSLVNVPICNLCKKVTVSQKYISNQKWKTRCNSCLSKSRTLKANTKRKRLCQENNVPFEK